MCSWDTRQIFFGAGTRLFVEPQNQPPAKPSVFIMKNGTNVACLVKDFYPKNVDISLQSSKKIIEFDPAIVVSPSGKYSAVKLGRYEDSNSVTCSVQHNKIWYSANFEKMTNSSDHLKPMEPEKKHQTSEIYHKPKAIHNSSVPRIAHELCYSRLSKATAVSRCMHFGSRALATQYCGFLSTHMGVKWGLMRLQVKEHPSPATPLPSPSANSHIMSS
ncbi:T-cell receptor delta chain C region [Myotis brandtii]|nr:T-cell receptor delta chain C region [Myotis brandtii]